MKYFVIAICLLFSGCWDWAVDFYVGDHLNEQIINSQGIAVKCIDAEFDNFGCLNKDNLKKLKQWIEQHCEQGNNKVADFILN